MLRRSLVMLAVIFSTACGNEPPPPVTLGDTWSCFAVSAGGMGWNHDVYRYTDGSTFTSCEIADGRNQIMGVSLYRADQAGNSYAGCNLTADWDTVDTNGWWKFSFSGATSTATYNDPGSTYHGMVATMTCTKY